MIIQGRLILNATDTPEPGWVEIDGDRIVALDHGAPPASVDAGDPNALICPGFIDAHLHLPQIDSIGCDGLDLLDWLDQAIYPAESAWSATDTARRSSATACRRMLRSGTLGFAGFLTSHQHAPASAAHALEKVPLRAIAGQVLMDTRAPDALIGHPLAALNDSPRYAASINPRFAVACTNDLMATAASIGAGRIMQTHLAESLRECELIARLFPDDPHYTGVYDRHGLLHERSLLAHCVHVSDDEWRLIAERRSVVVHCPGANTFLSSGLFNATAARDHGIRLALGTDIAAGPDLAMPRVARAMIEVAKLRRLTLDPSAWVPTPSEGWTMITAGNADALGWADAGRLHVGAAADVLVLRVPFEIDEHLFGRLLYTWRDDYISDRIVAGAARTV